MFGIDEIYEALLLEAKSPEEIKKILQYQFVDGKGVPQDVFDKVFELDPTKKKSYTKWVLMQWENSSQQIASAVKHGTLGPMFRYFQNRANTGLNLVSMPSFEAAIEKMPDSDPVFEPIPPGEEDLPEYDYEVVYDSPEWRIAVPHTYAASKRLGRGCKWCTAGAYGDSDHYFNHYSSMGPLWINYDFRGSEVTPMDNKEYPYIRYQFCFETSNNGELMNSHNARPDFTQMRIPEDVLSFYKSQNDSYYDIFMREINAGQLKAERERAAMEYEAMRRNAGEVLLHWDGVEDLLILPKFNYNNVIRDTFAIYTESDTQDSILGLEFDSVEEALNAITRRGDFLLFEVVSDILDKPVLLVPFSGVWRSFIDNEITQEKDGVVLFRGYNRWYIVSNILDEKCTEVYVNELYMPITMSIIGVYDGKICLQWRFINRGEAVSASIISAEGNQEIIIETDYPKNGQYIVRRDEKGYYMQGAIRKHYFDYNNNSADDNFRMWHKFSCPSGDKYLINYSDRGPGRFNFNFAIYDAEKQRVILKDIAVINLFEASNMLVYAKDNGTCTFYDFNKNKTYDLGLVSSVNDLRPNIYRIYYRNGEECALFYTDSGDSMGPFKQFRWLDDELAMVVFSNETEFRFLNFITRKISSCSFDYMKRVSYGKDKLYNLSLDNEKYLYNLETDTIIGKGGLIAASQVETPIYKVIVDGGGNLYNTKFGLLLPRPYEGGIWDSSPDGYFLIEMEEGLGYFFRYNESTGLELLSNPNGFDTKELHYANVNHILCLHFKNGYGFKFNRDNGQVTDIYNTLTKQVDNEIAQKIIKNIFPTQSISQISEGFKNLWNRMLDL
jgi:hypothetical protein